MNEQLVVYIRNALAKGMPKEEVRRSLLSTGWKDQDIDTAFVSIGESGKEAKVRAPVVVDIVSWLLFLSSIGYLFISLPLILLGAFGGSVTFLALGLLTLVRGVGVIIVSFGLRKMRRWALYAYTILFTLGVLVLIYGFITSSKPSLSEDIDILLEGAILIYFWVISKKFT